MGGDGSIQGKIVGMLKGDWQIGACCFTALYLAYDEWRLAPLSRWPKVADCLMVGHAADNVRGVLSDFRAAGLWEEAAILDEPGRLSLAEDLFCRGQVLTVFDGKYPAGWLDALGSGAPPAVWVEGRLPTAELVGVVGSRELPLEAQFFARQLGEHLVSSRRGVVSGGAWGADTLGVNGALSSFDDAAVVQILPCGLEAREGFGRRGNQGCFISPFGLRAKFTGSQAMIRNRLIYSWSRQAVVVHSRLRVGGTWGGATDALRRRLGRIVVADWHDSATDALVALGGERLCLGRNWRSELDFRLKSPLVLAQPDLFGGAIVRENLGVVQERRALYALA